MDLAGGDELGLDRALGELDEASPCGRLFGLLGRWLQVLAGHCENSVNK